MRIEPISQLNKNYSSTEYNLPNQQKIVDSVKVTLNQQPLIVLYNNKGKLRG